MSSSRSGEFGEVVLLAALSAVALVFALLYLGDGDWKRASAPAIAAAAGGLATYRRYRKWSGSWESEEVHGEDWAGATRHQPKYRASQSEAEAVIYPSPTNPGRAPIWENYVIAQAAQAALRLIPKSAVAIGVHVEGVEVELIFQLAQLTEEDVEDMDDIVDELQGLMGPRVRVKGSHELRTAPALSPPQPLRWIFAARA